LHKFRKSPAAADPFIDLDFFVSYPPGGTVERQAREARGVMAIEAGRRRVEVAALLI
jgi:hypothetical protein